MPGKTESKLVACESLMQEHREMENMLSRLEQVLSSPDLPSLNTLEATKAVMRQIEPAMNTHFACEEQVLFPAVSPYHPMVLMEAEHEELIKLRDTLLNLLQTPEERTCLKETGDHFISDMRDHIAREDAGIFPTCERALSDSEKEEVIEGMERIRKESEAQPTPTISRPERSFKVLPVDLDSPLQRTVFSERLSDAPGLEIKHLVIQAGHSLPEHWSPKHGTLICLKGKGTFIANGREAELKPGVTIMMSPQLLHGIQAQSDCHLLLLLGSQAGSEHGETPPLQ